MLEAKIQEIEAKIGLEVIETENVTAHHRRLMDQVVEEKKKVERIAPQHENFKKVENNIKRIMVLNDARSCVKSNLLTQKQKEANQEFKKFEGRLETRVQILEQEARQAEQFKEELKQFEERKDLILKYVKTWKEEREKQEFEKEKFLQDVNKRLKEIRFIKEIQILIEFQNTLLKLKPL